MLGNIIKIAVGGIVLWAAAKILSSNCKEDRWSHCKKLMETSPSAAEEYDPDIYYILAARKREGWD